MQKEKLIRRLNRRLKYSLYQVPKVDGTGGNMEKWLDIHGYTGFYQVSDLGRVKSMPRTMISDKDGKRRTYEGQVITLVPTKDGYMKASLWINGECKRLSVHRLVADAFLENPEHLPVVNHRNGDKHCNEVTNLEWVTYSYNTAHAHRSGLVDTAKGERHHKTTLTEKDVLKIYALAHSKKKTQKQIAEEFNTSVVTVSRIKNKQRWSHLFE